MSPSFMRGVWWVVLLCVGVYLTMLFFGSKIMATESGAHKPLMIRDVVEPGAHSLTGMIDVAFSCENVSVELAHTGSLYRLDLNTWRDSAECSPGPVPRAFALRVEAPSDTVFTATLDGTPIDIALQKQTFMPLPTSDDKPHTAR